MDDNRTEVSKGMASVALNGDAWCVTRNGRHRASCLRATADESGVVRVSCISKRFSRELSPCLELQASDLDEFAREWLRCREDGSAKPRLRRKDLERLLKDVSSLAAAVARDSGIALNDHR